MMKLEERQHPSIFDFAKVIGNVKIEDKIVEKKENLVPNKNMFEVSIHKNKKPITEKTSLV